MSTTQTTEAEQSTEAGGRAEPLVGRLLLTIALYGLAMVMAWAGYLLAETGDWRGALVGACSLLQWAVVRAVDSP